MARTHHFSGSALALAVLVYGTEALAVDCFIDSVGGNDGNSGLAEDQAVKSQAAIPGDCTVAKYKRGSQYGEALPGGFNSKIKTFTNYGDPCDPLPKFVMAGTTNTGSVVSAMGGGGGGGITIDGLYMANSHGDGSSSTSNFGQGVCVMIGGGSIVQNSEITNCDIGVMMMGEGSKFLNNYVHDLNTMIADAPQESGVNINMVGGAEAIFVNGSNNEVAYNQFVNCSGTSQWTGGGCDGGATEVSIGNNSTVSGVKIHHNFSYNNCGFFEVSSGTEGGTFADSDFYNNISIDSGWMFLLQVNNTALSNIRWENNTIVYHSDGGNSYGTVVSMIYDGTGTSGQGNAVMGTVQPNTVFFNNNLLLFDGFGSNFDAAGTVDDKISQSNNLFLTTTSGVVKNAGQAGVMPSPADFDLVDGSPAIDQGMGVATVTLDFLNRTVPAGAAPDIGAFEHGSALGAGQSTPVTTMDWVTGKAGCGAPAGTGGDASAATGGAPDGAGGAATGGAPGAGGSTAPADGGSTPDGAGGTPGAGGSSTVTPGAGGGTAAGGAGTSTNGTGGNSSSPGPDGTTLTCAGSLTLCGSVCIDLTSNPNHCGSCNNVCGAGLVCSAGACTNVCAAGTTLCGQSCVNLTADVLNCGACDQRCLGGQICANSECTGTVTGDDPTVPVETPVERGTAASDLTENPAGCGCVAAGSGSDGRGALAGLLLGLVALGTRRRRAG